MFIRVTCPACRFAFKVDARHAGKRGLCPNPACREKYTVPAAPTSSGESPEVKPAAAKSEPAAASPSRTARRPEPREASRTKPAPIPTAGKRRKTAARSSRPRRPVVFATAAVIAAGLLATWAVWPRHAPIAGDLQAAAKAPPPPPKDTYKSDIRPLLKKYCFDCHGPDKQQADIALHKYEDAAAVTEDRETWERVLEVLETQVMPPEGQPQPSGEELQLATKWIEGELYHLDCTLADGRDPGRVTIRRLNRAEYNNTIRDLLGIKFQPAEDFPSDDVGYGFDNIGDVLSLPPLLMEKYLNAAEKIADAVVSAESAGAKPPRDRFTSSRAKTSGSAQPNGSDGFGLPSRGEVIAPLQVAKAGEYILRAEAGAQQAGPDPAKMEFLLDDKPLHTFDVKARRNEREVYEWKVKLEPGSQKFAAAFTNDYYNKDAPNPRDRDRNLYITYLEVEGPLDHEPNLGGNRLLIAYPGRGKSEKECATEIITKFAPRAYRRPVTADEVARLVQLAEFASHESHSFERGVGVALQAMLVSPHFLFRVERDTAPDDPQAKHQVADFELASRLSYFLWSSTPDDELFQLASQGTLHRSEVLEQQVRRMLQDPKAQALVDGFAAQWLQLRNLDEIAPDPKLFPKFNAGLKADMQQETQRFFAAVMHEDRELSDFLTGDFTFVNERLAEHYGLPDVKGEEFRQVSLPQGQRAGILTHASILTITSNPGRTSPVKRGKWILETILGAPPPPPPPNVPELEETAKAAPGASLREQLKLHRSDPGCASCHRQMDELGFGLENFNPVGQWRDADGTGPIDASGTLPGGASFKGPAELVGVLKKRQAEFNRCLTEKMLTYALGRGLEFYDRCAVDQVTQNVSQKGNRFSTLVVEIVNSEPFRMRRGEGAKP